jgi:hypothetical protein
MKYIVAVAAPVSLTAILGAVGANPGVLGAFFIGLFGSMLILNILD